MQNWYFPLRVETKIVMVNLESKMATLDEAKGGHMARLGQKKLQKPEDGYTAPRPTSSVPSLTDPVSVTSNL